MEIGDLVRIIGYAVALPDVGVVVQLRPAEKNGVRVIYGNVLMPDRSLLWLSPECVEVLDESR